MNDNKKLVLFDFDLTITTKDTLFLFTRYFVGRYRYYIGMIWLSIPLTLHVVKVISSHRIKEMFLTHFFSGVKSKEFEMKCNQFAAEILPRIIRTSAKQDIEYYKVQGDRVIIVSASPDEWIIPWANKLAIEVVATRLEHKAGNLTGKLSGMNCNGEEKVRRLIEKVKVEDYIEIVAYGDSKGDLPMLKLATKVYFKSFMHNT